jgi:cytochrome c peroxidase
MKFNFALSFAIVISMSACGGDHAADPGLGQRDAGAGATGPTVGSGSDDSADAGASEDDGPPDASAPESNGDAGASDESDGERGVGGSKSDGRNGAGGSENGRHDAGGSNSDAGASESDGDDNAAGSHGDGPRGAGGSSGVASTGGSGGISGRGGSGGLSTNGGAAGLSANAGSGGLPMSGGFGGLSANGGSGDLSSGAGAGGLSASAGAGGLSTSDGSGGVSASGGSGGVSNGAGAAGVSGSAGSGGAGGDDDPRYLFTTETFGGNGRTCTTCHTSETGTISPAQVQALYSTNPSDPLFRPLDSDDGVGDDYGELEAHATFRVAIPLPTGVRLTSDPTATSIVLRRSVPTTINTPALDPVIMWDGREPSLTSQALDAILGHAQATVTPTTTELQLIAEFERGPDFFSSDLLRNYSQGGPEPTWPPGVTDSEQRGRRWFAQDSAAPRFNICGQCHGGPMANTTQSNSGLPVGQRFQTVNVSEFNVLGNPSFEFTFPDPKNPGKTVTVTTPDPGRALITGDVRDLNFFKIPTLWGVKNTAPYFHDNSAATLDELMDHYKKHLATFLPSNVDYPRPHVPTDQDKADIIAYLQLL